jgi:hypothetical protein
MPLLSPTCRANLTGSRRALYYLNGKP